MCLVIYVVQKSSRVIRVIKLAADLALIRLSWRFGFSTTARCKVWISNVINVHLNSMLIFPSHVLFLSLFLSSCSFYTHNGRAVVIPNFDILRRSGREFFRVLAGVRLALKLELIVVAGLSRAYERGRTTNE